MISPDTTVAPFTLDAAHAGLVPRNPDRQKLQGFHHFLTCWKLPLCSNRGIGCVSQKRPQRLAASGQTRRRNRRCGLSGALVSCESVVDWRPCLKIQSKEPSNLRGSPCQTAKPWMGSFFSTGRKPT